jgi:hypothetical protein
MISSISLDGGKVRLRSPFLGEASYWRDYKAAFLNEHWVGACFRDDLNLMDWIQAHRLAYPLVCLGDGHPGIWKLFQEIATEPQRFEILDWYHLQENLFKVGGSLKPLAQAESFLWHGDLESVLSLFQHSQRKSSQNFCAYLKHYTSRIVNYAYL